ncbi:MAG: hypothetical protein Q8K05_07850 [Polaromonas sp.]|uniref:hypothetical protein n=1 Tax=Polaromonas sp. TaxID=1869339 RepID=UPI0027309C73|nr:hypothetical protein [Polaromonas sp.]MDP2255952.1 hypothetical protein [Polaromonas sp.]
MKDIAEKLVKAEQQMSDEKGRFLLFALFLREDAPDLWDLLVSADWIEANKGEALRYITGILKSVVEPIELSKLSRIVIIEQTNPALGAIQSAFHIEHSVADVQSSNFFGLQIKHAYIITSRREGT